MLISYFFEKRTNKEHLQNYMARLRRRGIIYSIFYLNFTYLGYISILQKKIIK